MVVIFSEDGEIDVSELGSKSCVTRFIKKMLSIVSLLLLTPTDMDAHVNVRYSPTSENPTAKT